MEIKVFRRDWSEKLKKDDNRAKKMEQAILLSIQPQHAAKILNGDKTLELRKSVPKDFVGWVYIYVTKSKLALVNVTDMTWTHKSFEIATPKQISNGYFYMNSFDILNGKVVARFWFDEYDILIPITHDSLGFNYHYIGMDKCNKKLHKDLCLGHYEVGNYGKGKRLFAWHIDNLEIFDKPKELREFYKKDGCDYLKETIEWYREKNQLVNYHEFVIDKAPKSWQYVYTKMEGKE